MKKAQKIRLCDWTLLVLVILTLVSSIQLEISGNAGFTPVILHVIAASLFMGFCVYHIYLHFKWQRWFFKFRKLKSIVTKLLWWSFLITLVSGAVALIHWLGTFAHSPIGAVHGKIGFLMIALAIGHTLKRSAFFRGKTLR